MERSRMRDDDSSPHATENPAAPLIQADSPLLTPSRREFDPEYPTRFSTSPSTASFWCSDKSRVSSPQSLRLKLTDLRFEPSRSKPLFRGFERPSFSRIAILTLLCLLTYPVFCILKLAAKDRSLFAVRSIVSVWCSAVGLALGYILLNIGARHLEAATWATLIHLSHEGDGMKLRDLARGSSDPKSFMPAFHILLSRFRNRGTSRRLRKPYDKRPWSLFLAFFVILAILAPLLPFLFGRIVEIKVFIRPQPKVYSEVLITGDLSEEDISRAGDPTRSPITDPYTAEFVYGNDTVYFAQPSPSQFVSGGSGAGTFNPAPAMGVKGPLNNTLAFADRNTPKNDTGAILRYPQWGIRIHCEKLPDPRVNMVPFSEAGYTYAFIPRDFLQGLFGMHGMDLPTDFTKPARIRLFKNDTIPSNIDPSTISYVVKLSGNGYSVQLHSVVASDVASNQGWMTVDTAVIRLNTSLTPSGRFPVYWNESLRRFGQVRLGFDAVVCVQKYEPWIIEAYNTSTGSSFASRIVEKQSNLDSTSLSPSGTIRGAQVENTRYLNTTGKDIVFSAAHGFSLNRFTEANDDLGRTTRGLYTPTSTIVSFTEGTGSLGYVELSSDRFAVFRARADAVNVLPYLVGSGPVVAQLFKDETLAYTTYKPWQLIALPVLVLILGTIGELFVPALPFGIPRREFGVYSWLALFQSQELQFEAAEDLGKFMSLDELEKSFSDKRVKFVV